MRKCAKQYRELPQGNHEQYSEDCGNENLSLALNCVVDGTPMGYANQSHFDHLNHALPRLNTKY